MYITAYDEHQGAIDALTAKILTPELVAALKKKLSDELTPVWEAAVDEILAGAAESVCRVAAERATKFLEAVLAGDADAAQNLFGLSGFTGRWRTSPVIHGRIFESDPIKLRRELVEAHADLLRGARIADLESLLRAACLQVAQLQREADNRSRYYAQEECP